jgi:flagellar protein FlaG
MDIQTVSAPNVYENSNAAYNVQIQSQSQYQNDSTDARTTSGQGAAPASSSASASSSTSNASQSQGGVGQKSQSAASSDGSQINAKKMQKSVDSANSYLDQFDLSMRLQLDKNIQQFYVQLVDQSTGKVIKTYPPKEYLELQDRLKEYYGNAEKEDRSDK